MKSGQTGFSHTPPNGFERIGVTPKYIFKSGTNVLFQSLLLQAIGRAR